MSSQQGEQLDTDHGPRYSEVDNSKLVPLLWNAIQELSAKVVDLEQKLAAAGL